jgi:nicotinamidase-related amidase
MRDCLLLIDLFSDFSHEDGDVHLEALKRKAPVLIKTLARARAEELPVVFANDTNGVWDGDGRGLLERAFGGPGGDLLRRLEPRSGEALLVKPRYSAFDLTPLSLVLTQLEIERLLVVGSATEMCVTQTAIDARERGFKVTVLTEACVPLDEEHAKTALKYLEQVTGTQLAPRMEFLCAT